MGDSTKKISLLFYPSLVFNPMNILSTQYEPKYFFISICRK
jgi:hypothetical protein